MYRVILERFSLLIYFPTNLGIIVLSNDTCTYYVCILKIHYNEHTMIHKLFII